MSARSHSSSTLQVPFTPLLSAETGTRCCAWTTSPALSSFASSSIKATPRKSFANLSRSTSPLRHQDRHRPHRRWRRVRRRIPIAPERAGDQARDNPYAHTSIQRRRGAGAWTPTRRDRGPFTMYDRRQERPPLGESQELRLRNVKPLRDNLPHPSVSTYELWVGFRPTLDHLIPFGTVGYLRRPKVEQTLAPRRVKCIMLGIDTNYPRQTHRYRGNYFYLQALGLGIRSGSTQLHWDRYFLLSVPIGGMFSSASTQSEACLFFLNSADDGINTKHVYTCVDQVFPSLESNKIKRSGSTQPLWDEDIFFGVYSFGARLPNQRPVYFFATVPAVE